MGTTYVYNTGAPLNDSPGTLKLTYGVFFDGTLNNRENTMIRKKVEKRGEFRLISPTEEELRIYKKYAKEDNSFGNDFTNVARKSFCCNENYTIYVEGIGTVDKKNDKGKGFKYGKSTTGIIAKVRNGCKALAEKIKKAKDSSNNKRKLKEIELTLDIFGFSRGSAAARNFAYNLQMSEYAPKSYYPPVQGAQRTEVDHQEIEFRGIEKSWVKDGMLPKFGHLGTSLLEAGISRDLVDDMTIIVRFIGIYDTVASYDPECFLFPDFKGNIAKLHLHEIGNPRRAVHFTAADEHRKNFSLTRFSHVELRNGIERNFPGVHSDIGGSYNHDALSATEVGNLSESFGQPDPVEGVCGSEYVWLERKYFSSSFEDKKSQLIEEGWFTKKQLQVERDWRSWGLTGRRYLYRGYSFIPLHFMCDYALPYLNEDKKYLFYSKLMADYALNDAFLEDVKKYLKRHCIDKNENWVLKGEYHYQNMVENTENKEPAVETFPETNQDVSIPTIELEEVVVTGYRSDSLLRELRNKYLHRSARLNTIADTLGHRPNADLKRK